MFTSGKDQAVKKDTVVKDAGTVRAENAQKPVQEFTDFIQQPTIQEPTQYRTEYQYQERQEAPIKLKEQPIQLKEQRTVVQQQPIVVNKQEVQIEKEKPIEVLKQTVDVQQLPAIQKKEYDVKVVQASDQPTKVVNTQFVEKGVPVNYQVQATPDNANAIASMDQEGHHHHSVIERIKEKVGGTKQAAHEAIEVAREKAREVFTGTGSSAGASSVKETTSTSASSTTTNVNVQTRGVAQ
jgi:hypothetical protein